MPMKMIVSSALHVYSVNESIALMKNELSSTFERSKRCRRFVEGSRGISFILKITSYMKTQLFKERVKGQLTVWGGRNSWLLLTLGKRISDQQRKSPTENVWNDDQMAGNFFGSSSDLLSISFYCRKFLF